MTSEIGNFPRFDRRNAVYTEGSPFFAFANKYGRFKLIFTSFQALFNFYYLTTTQFF
jgi:hypothetical protein